MKPGVLYIRRVPPKKAGSPDLEGKQLVGENILYWHGWDNGTYMRLEQLGARLMHTEGKSHGVPASRKKKLEQAMEDLKASYVPRRHPL